jgi:hypothetical protein
MDGATDVSKEKQRWPPWLESLLVEKTKEFKQGEVNVAEHVQSPKLGPFSYNDLSWSQSFKFEGNIAFIRPERLDDYLLGEGERSNCSWTLHNVTKRVQTENLRSNSVLFSTTYYCAYGPTDDRNKVHVTNPSEKTSNQRSMLTTLMQ